MKIFDFNIHLPHQIINDTDGTISNEVTISAKQLAAVFKQNVDKIKNISSNANIMLFNPAIFDDRDISLFTKEFHSVFPDSSITLLADFRHPDPIDYLKKAKSGGARFIKFHSYVQKIGERDFEDAVKMAMVAQDLNMPVCIDASFGTTGMYTYDNLKLATSVAGKVTKVPVIILHCGGARIIEAMLIADERKNVFLETSFSVDYYQGSSLENDFAFAYKKIGCNRVLFGSDFPYIGNETAKNNTIRYLEKNKFSTKDIENILFNNAMSIING